MSFGVVPASSSLRGPTGYFAADGNDNTTAAEERQSLLQVSTAACVEPGVSRCNLQLDCCCLLLAMLHEASQPCIAVAGNEHFGCLWLPMRSMPQHSMALQPVYTLT